MQNNSDSAHAATPPPIILDIEASGFGLGSYPIEIGFIMDDGRSWCSLVKPEPSWEHWDPNAAALHGIGRDQLQKHGRSSLDIAQTLNDWLHHQVVYTDAWAHDYTWLNKIFEAANLSPSFKLDNLRTLLSDQDAEQWHVTKLRVAKLHPMPRHRASNDARLLQLTVQALKQAQAEAA